VLALPVEPFHDGQRFGDRHPVRSRLRHLAVEAAVRAERERLRYALGPFERQNEGLVGERLAVIRHLPFDLWSGGGLAAAGDQDQEDAGRRPACGGCGHYQSPSTMPSRGSQSRHHVVAEIPVRASRTLPSIRPSWHPDALNAWGT